MKENKLTWGDALAIGERLAEEYADVDPRTVRYTDLHRYVRELLEFGDDPEACTELLLEAIQMAWMDEA